MKALNYTLNPRKNKGPFDLNLYRAERYDAAVVVQQLIGNLVYFSNYGRYEPRIAESWSRTAPDTWVFKLRPGFECENGEKITPISFKKSLERNIKNLFKLGGAPIVSKLIGYQAFTSGKASELSGIKADENSLTFKFDQPLRSGLLQILSFAPFGYICEANYGPNDEWKDDNKFVSSGPYRVAVFEKGQKAILEARAEWPFFIDESPKTVNFKFTHHEENSQAQNGPEILDSFVALENVPQSLKHYRLVPEYLWFIEVNEQQSDFFKIKDNRLALGYAIERARARVDISKLSGVEVVRTFYPVKTFENIYKGNPPHVKAPTRKLIIGGNEPGPDSSAFASWLVLKDALAELDWSYEFSPKTMGTMAPTDLDLMGQSIGGGFESWGIEVIFCSAVGLSPLPDPSGRVCKLVKEYENTELSDAEATSRLIQAIEEDAAVHPITRSGLNWYISNDLDESSFSPLVCVLRLDQLKVR